MPVYEYKCKSCGKEFEFEQRIIEDPITNCPVEGCNGEVFRKISKNVGLVFKGSGFYLTDYAKKHESATTHTNGHNGNSTSDKEVTAVKQTEKDTSTKTQVNDNSKDKSKSKDISKASA